MVQAIGSNTISAIATSGPEIQVCIVCTCMCVCVCVSVRVCVCMCVCVCVCVCVYAPLHALTDIHTHTHTHTHKHTHTCVFVCVCVVHLYGTLHKNLCERCKHKCKVVRVVMSQSSGEAMFTKTSPTLRAKCTSKLMYKWKPYYHNLD